MYETKKGEKERASGVPGRAPWPSKWRASVKLGSVARSGARVAQVRMAADSERFQSFPCLFFLSFFFLDHLSVELEG